MLQSDWPRQHSGAVHGMLAIVTRPSSPDGLARETKCWDGEKQLCISQVVEGLATNSG